MISEAIRYCIIVLLCLPLAGCFKSDVALIDQSNADWPFKRASVSILSDGQRRTYELELRSSSYVLTNTPADDKSLKDGTILFHKVQNDLFIMQWREPAAARFDYFIVNMKGNQFTMDICKGRKDETLARFGIQLDDIKFCVIKNLQQLVSLAKVPLDEPDQRFTAGEVLHSEK